MRRTPPPASTTRASPRSTTPASRSTRATGVPVPFLVMELVDGPTLRDVLREKGPLPAGRALELTRVVLGGLGHSHSAGIVHRDIKPSNIMLTPKGDAKVMDFGIARAAAETTSDLTGTATVIGTAHYLSPEQARGERVDQRSDLYSTGCLLYELLLGRPPFVGDSSVSVAYQHVRETPAAAQPGGPDAERRHRRGDRQGAGQGPGRPVPVRRGDGGRHRPRPRRAAGPCCPAVRAHPGHPRRAGPLGAVTGDGGGGGGHPRPAWSGRAGAAGGAAAAGADPRRPPARPWSPTRTEPTERPPSAAGRTVLVALLTVLVLAGLAFGAYWLLAGGPSNRSACRRCWAARGRRPSRSCATPACDRPSATWPDPMTTPSAR